MKNLFTSETAQNEFEKGFKPAKEMLNDKDKVERFLQRLEKKLKTVPYVGNTLACVPVMASLVRSYIKNEYTDIPIGSIIAILSALIYFLSPIDIIPDGIPIIGLTDDAAVIALCLKMVQTDVDEYVEWRKSKGLEIRL